MKKFVFYICTFVLISLAVGSKKIGSGNENYDTCLTENDASNDDIFTIHDIIHDKHKSEDQEKIKKNGCVMQCLLQKAGVMEEAEYDAEKMHDEFIKRTNAQPGDKMIVAFDDCVNETKDLTEKCEKSLALTECFIKAEEKNRPCPSESDEEHEHEHEDENKHTMFEKL